MPRASLIALPLALACVAGCDMPVSTGPLAAFPEEFQGFWATDIYSQCPNHALVGQSEEAPVAINSTQLLGLENSCTVLQAVRGGEGILTTQLSCRGEGETEEVTATFYRSGRALTFNRGDGSVLWSRCPVMLREDGPAIPVEEAPAEEAVDAPIADVADDASLQESAARILGITPVAETAE